MIRNPQHFIKEERKMRKLFIAFTVALLIIPTIAFAQEGKAEALRAALNAKLSPSIEAPQAKSAEPQVASEAIVYTWGAIFTYQASDNYWWSGLVIRNGPNPNYMKVRLFDSIGNLAGEGTFYLGAFNEQRIGVLKDMIGVGYVPEVGSVYVFGTNYYSTMMFVGNGSGGFGMIEKESINF
jgi:hypothetical protein